MVESGRWWRVCHSPSDGLSRCVGTRYGIAIVWQLCTPEHGVKAHPLEVRQLGESPPGRCRLKKRNTCGFMGMVLILIKIHKITCIMASSKDNVSASWIITECSKHFCDLVSTRDETGSKTRTFDLVVCTFLAMTYIDNREKRLVERKALRECSQISRPVDETH